jgi:3-isopropylmalate/(R)-2-methylmalate dehydratase small subunit
VTRQPFATVVGPAAPLLVANLDTDVIIRVERMTSTNPDDLAPYAFESLRYRDDGSEEPGFVLNDPRFRGAPILILGANFGCGSSREPAVWAIKGLGIRCLIAPSFGDIFAGNCVTNGLLPVVLDAAAVEQLAEVARGGSPLTVDLEQQVVGAGGAAWRFEISTIQKVGLLEGLDDMELALRFAADTAEWERNDRRLRPWAWTSGSAGSA